MTLTNAEWRKLKKRAPKVPDITCPAIDDVLKRLTILCEDDKPLSEYKLGVICRRLEKLRTANELLRDSGVYWYDIAKDHLKK
ncbi:MAG: hypothetical protein CMA31_01980 [Euryarchaeota archaeon]|jgi:hypothetical protein|nr:hypothetical protein [Euryarchaeota archaeon]